MSVDPVVRRAIAADWNQCVRIDDEARRVVAPERGGAAWLAEHPPLGERALSAWGDVLVGEIDGVVVGLAVAAARELSGRGRVMMIDRVHVVAEARGLGFGDALLAALVDAARVADCDEIEGVALPGDRETKNMYERAGVTARSIVVAKRLV